MGAYVVRGEGIYEEEPTTPKEIYAGLSAEQFVEFAKCYMKNTVMDPNNNSWFNDLALAHKQRMNKFFESLPDYLFDFSTEGGRRLMLMYITSNFRFGLGYSITDIGEEKLIRCIERITEVDPRMYVK